MNPAWRGWWGKSRWRPRTLCSCHPETAGTVLAEALGERLGDALAGADPELLCSAHDVALLAVEAFQEGSGVPAEQGLPVYLRDQVAWKKAGV